MPSRLSQHSLARNGAKEPNPEEPRADLPWLKRFLERKSPRWRCGLPGSTTSIPPGFRGAVPGEKCSNRMWRSSWRKEGHRRLFLRRCLPPSLKKSCRAGWSLNPRPGPSQGLLQNRSCSRPRPQQKSGSMLPRHPRGARAPFTPPADHRPKIGGDPEYCRHVDHF